MGVYLACGSYSMGVALAWAESGVEFISAMFFFFASFRVSDYTLFGQMSGFMRNKTVHNLGIISAV